MESIKIAGGGISGLTCAITLAKAGVPVEVYERKAASGGRFYGDLQGLENWTTKTDVLKEIRNLGLDVELPITRLPSLRVIDGKGFQLDFKQARPLCYLVKRGIEPDSLDQTLYQAAVRAGVRFNFSQALAVEDAQVVATGPRSREVFAIDTGVHFQTHHEDIAVAIVNDQAAYRGYAYLLIVNGYGCICTVMFDRFKQIHQHYEHTLSIFKKHLSFDMLNPKRVGGVGSFSNDLCFAKDGKYFVGEAAGLQDLLWGFGIRSAISSGALAARCLIEGADYGKMAEALFSQQLKSGIVIRYLFEKFSRLPKGYTIMGKLVGGQTNPAEFLRKAYGFTPVHKVILPLAKKNMQKRYPALYF